MDLYDLQGGFSIWSIVVTFFMLVFVAKANDAVGLCGSSVIVHGYQCEEFYVKTEDGFVLNMQRISRERSSGHGNVNREPVLLQHGVLVDGMSWLVNPPQESLPFVLVDSGFEVWIAHTRGTRFSRQHATLDAYQPEYWNWSWDELVEYDLPATFNLVYHQTGQKLHYVGHSLGTLIALASFSEGKLVDMLRSAALLSPVAYLSHMTTALGVLAAKAFLGELFTSLVGVAEFNPKADGVAQFLNYLCKNPGIDCYDLMTSITGQNCCLNASTVDLFLKNEPQSTSTKNFIHLAQTVRDGVLSKFDYGFPGKNRVHYGQGTPPRYNLSNIPRNLPLFFSYGGKDALSDVKDVEMLLQELKFHQGKNLTTLFIENYAHQDFIMGVNVKEMVYNSIVSFFRAHS